MQFSHEDLASDRIFSVSWAYLIQTTRMRERPGAARGYLQRSLMIPKTGKRFFQASKRQVPPFSANSHPSMENRSTLQLIYQEIKLTGPLKDESKIVDEDQPKEEG